MFNNINGGWGANKNYKLPKIKERKIGLSGRNNQKGGWGSNPISDFFKKIKGQKP